MAMFHSYVSLPEGNKCCRFFWGCNIASSAAQFPENPSLTSLCPLKKQCLNNGMVVWCLHLVDGKRQEAMATGKQKRQLYTQDWNLEVQIHWPPSPVINFNASTPWLQEFIAMPRLSTYKHDDSSHNFRTFWHSVEVCEIAPGKWKKFYDNPMKCRVFHSCQIVRIVPFTDNHSMLSCYPCFTAELQSRPEIPAIDISRNQNSIYRMYTV